MAMNAGFSISDLDLIEFGVVMDVITECGNDQFKYKEVANQADFDRF